MQASINVIDFYEKCIALKEEVFSDLDANKFVSDMFSPYPGLLDRVTLSCENNTLLDPHDSVNFSFLMDKKNEFMLNLSNAKAYITRFIEMCEWTMGFENPSIILSEEDVNEFKQIQEFCKKNKSFLNGNKTYF